MINHPVDKAVVLQNHPLNQKSIYEVEQRLTSEEEQRLTSEEEQLIHHEVKI